MCVCCIWCWQPVAVEHCCQAKHDIQSRLWLAIVATTAWYWRERVRHPRYTMSYMVPCWSASSIPRQHHCLKQGRACHVGFWMQACMAFANFGKDHLLVCNSHGLYDLRGLPRVITTRAATRRINA
jgi:hypothetical protein